MLPLGATDESAAPSNTQVWAEGRENTVEICIPTGESLN